MKALLQQALDALDATYPLRSCFTTDWAHAKAYGVHDAAIVALRAAIAQGDPTVKESLTVESEPLWFACDTPGAEFDITFVTTREEAAMAVDCALADDPDLKFDDIVTPLYAAPGADYVPLSDDDIRAEFATMYPNDDGILRLSENNHDYAIYAIGASHHWMAFKDGARAIERAVRGVK